MLYMSFVSADKIGLQRNHTYSADRAVLTVEFSVPVTVTKIFPFSYAIETVNITHSPRFGISIVEDSIIKHAPV